MRTEFMRNEENTAVISPPPTPTPSNTNCRPHLHTTPPPAHTYTHHPPQLVTLRVCDSLSLP